MAALIAGVLGLLGTVVGAVLGAWTARQAADRTARYSREETRRKEYRSAVVRFADQMIKYRLAEVKLWHALASGEDTEEAIDERNRSRSDTWNAFYELQLSTSRGLSGLAERAMTSATSISRQKTREAMDEYQTKLRNEVGELISSARQELSGQVADVAGRPVEPTAEGLV